MMLSPEQTFRRSNTQTIGEALSAFLRESGLDKPVYEHQLMERWPEVVGEMAAKLTYKLEVRDGVLYVRLRSAALKAQLFELRHDVVRRLNEAVGITVIHDIRLLG